MSNPDQYIELCSAHRDRVTYPQASDFEVTLSADGNMTPINFIDGISNQAVVVPAAPTGSIPDPWNLYVLNSWQHAYFDNATDGRVSVPESQTVELRVQLLTQSSDKTSFYVQGIIDSRPSAVGISQEANILLQRPGAYDGAIISQRSIFSNAAPTNNQSTIRSSTFVGNNTMLIVVETPLLSFLTTTNFFIQTMTRPGVADAAGVIPPSTGQIFVPGGVDMDNAYEDWYIVNETRNDWQKITQYDGFSHLITLENDVPLWRSWDSVSIRVAPPGESFAVGIDDDNVDMLPSPLNPSGGATKTIFHISHLPQKNTPAGQATVIGGTPPARSCRPGDYLEILFGSATSFEFANQPNAAIGATTMTFALEAQLVGLNVGDQIVGLIPETVDKLGTGTRITAFNNTTITFQPPLSAAIVAADQFAIQGGGAKYFSVLVDSTNTSNNQILLDVNSRPPFDNAYAGMKVLWPTGSSTNFIAGFLSVDRTGTVLPLAVGQGSANDPATAPCIVTGYNSATGILSIDPPLPAAPGPNNAAGDCSLMIIPFRETRKISKYVQFTGVAEAITETTIVLPSRSIAPYVGEASKRNGHYNKLYISITNYQSGGAGPAVPEFQTRTVVRYDAATRLVTFSEPINLTGLTANPSFEINCGEVAEAFTSPISIGTITGFNPAAPPAANARSPARYQSTSQIMRTQIDNNSPLLYSGSIVSQQSAVCYSIRLVNLIVPNAPILGGLGGRIAFYPYLYVRLTHNMSSPSRGNPTSFSSNNPNAKYQTFRVPIDDIPDPIQSNFIKLNSNYQTVAVKFRPNDALRVSVHLPNGDLFRTVLHENCPPSIPNELAQISYCFSIKRSN